MSRFLNKSLFGITFFVSLLLTVYSLLPVPVAQASFINSPPLFTGSSLKSGLQAWWTFDGSNLINNITDSSGNAKTSFFRNMTSTSTGMASGRLGQGYFFNATVVASSSPVVTGSTDKMTIAFWLKASGRTGGTAVDNEIYDSLPSQVFMNYYPNSTDTCYSADTGMGIAVHGNNGFNFQCYTRPSDNVWHFFVATYDIAQGVNEEQLYIDGDLKTNFASSITNNTGNFSNLQFCFMSADCNNTARTAGALDDFRVYNRVLSLQEIQELYIMGRPRINKSPTTFPSPLRTGLTGWWTMDGSDINWSSGVLSDRSGNGFNGALQAFSTTTSGATGKIGQALKFNGSTQFITTSNALSQFMSSATGTMSAWFNGGVNNSTSCYDGSGSLLVGDGTASGGFAWLGYDGQTVCAGAFDGATRVIAASSTAGRWTHALWTHKNGVLSLWINGALVNSTAMANITDLTHAVHMGKSFNSKFFNGYLDDVRIYNSALSTTSIQQLYNTGAGNKLGISVLPNSTNPLQTGLVSWWTFDGKDRNYSAGTFSDKSNSGNEAVANAIDFRQLAEVDVVANSNSATTAAFASTVQSGNLMVVWVWYNSNTLSVQSVSDTGGNSYSLAIGPTTGAGGLAAWRSEIWYAKNITGGTNFKVTATLTGTATIEKAVSAHEYSGADLGAPLDGTAGQATSGNTPSSGNITPTSAGDTIFGAFVLGGGSATPGSGFFQRSGLASNITEDGYATSTNAIAATYTNPSNSDNIAQAAAFKPASLSTSPGKLGQAYALSKSLYATSSSDIDAVVPFPNTNLVFSSGSSISISAWIKPTMPTADAAGIVSKQTTCTNIANCSPNYGLFVESGSAASARQLSFGYLKSGSGIVEVWDTTSSVLPYNKWSHVVFTYTFATAASATAYINGVSSAGSWVVDTGAVAPDTTANGIVRIGNSYNTNDFFGGSIDDVRIYNRTLSAKEVQQLYQMGR